MHMSCVLIYVVLICSMSSMGGISKNIFLIYNIIYQQKKEFKEEFNDYQFLLVAKFFYNSS